MARGSAGGLGASPVAQSVVCGTLPGMPSRRTPRVRRRPAGSTSPSSGPGQDPLTAQLLARCRANAEDAWEEFLDRYGRLIYSTIARVGLPPDDREEAFQDTVAAIYRQIGRLRESDRLVSWIIGIAWRQSINRIRARVRESQVGELDERVFPDRGSVGGTGPMPDELRLRLERAQQAREALDALPERCRRLLEYLFFHDPPPDYAEIARREGFPIGSLGPTRARCLEKMRSYFEQRGWL